MRTPPPPPRDDLRFSNTTGILQKRSMWSGDGLLMWFIGVEVEQETSAPPPKKNPGSAPDSVISHAFAYCQDGVENRNKVYSIPPASHSFRTFHLLPPIALPPPFSPGLPLPSSHKQKTTATSLFLFRRGSKNRVFENSGFHCIAD